MTIQTFEDVLSALTHATEHESLALFAQGDALLVACEPDTLRRIGFASRAQLFAEVGNATGMSRRTLYNRIKVAEVFAPGERAEGVRWGVHLVAASTESPHAWLAAAADNGWSPDVLRNQIAAAAGKADAAERFYVCRAREATVVQVAGNRVTFAYDVLPDIAPGERVWMTLSADTDDVRDDVEAAA